MEALSDKYKTDKFKWCHNYTSKYEELFKDKKNLKLKILEIGIGSVGQPSLKLWKEYFKNAEIYGVDIEPSFIRDEERIHTFLCSSLNNTDVETILSPAGPFDIIIDDGCHRCDGQQITFSNLFNLLSDKGIYIIEDCGSSFNSGYHNSHIQNNTLLIGPPDKRIKSDLPAWCIENNNKNSTCTTVKVFNDYKSSRKLNSFFIKKNISNEKLLNIEQNIDTVEFWKGNTVNDSLIIIIKK
jgi:hypothetical protein